MPVYFYFNFPKNHETALSPRALPAKSLLAKMVKQIGWVRPIGFGLKHKKIGRGSFFCITVILNIFFAGHHERPMNW